VTVGLVAIRVNGEVEGLSVGFRVLDFDWWKDCGADRWVLDVGENTNFKAREREVVKLTKSRQRFRCDFK